jgi:hypothetical protein
MAGSGVLVLDLSIFILSSVGRIDPMIGVQDQKSRGLYSYQMTTLCQERRKFDEASLGHLADFSVCL